MDERLSFCWMKPGTVILLLALCWGWMAMAFEPPDADARLKAIGSTDELPPLLRRAFTPDADFRPIPGPGPNDWLTAHPEPGQTFSDFKRSLPNRPGSLRRVLYLQPLGEFPSQRSPSLETLREFAAIYFQMKARALPPTPVTNQTFTTRLNPYTRNRQILTEDVLRFLTKQLPEDAFCLLAITMEDLYPDPSWNFVFGQASLRERAGVYSFARYDPAFSGERRTRDYTSLLLRRSGKVLVHETAHMFGLAHCIYFDCVMNGSNHLGESDRRPLHLCPVCLRKLQWSIGFEVVKRYEALRQFYRTAGFADEEKWSRQRLDKLKAAAEE